MNRIKAIREMEGLSLQELSSLTGIPYQSLRNYEIEKREPRNKQMWHTIANALKVPVTYLMGFEVSTVNSEIREHIDAQLSGAFGVDEPTLRFHYLSEVLTEKQIKPLQQFMRLPESDKELIIQMMDRLKSEKGAENMAKYLTTQRVDSGPDGGWIVRNLEDGTERFIAKDSPEVNIY